MCPPPAQAQGGQAQAQTFPTLSCTLPVVCFAGQAQQGGQAQAQTATIALCTGIPYVCGSQAQAQTFSLPPFCPTPANAGGGQGQAQTMLSAPPHCGGIYTNATICPAPAAGGQAQTPPPSVLCATNIGCPPPAAGAAGQQGGQAPVPHTLFGCVVSAVCGGGHPTHTGPVSLATICPTHAPACPPHTIHPVTVHNMCHPSVPSCLPGQSGGQQQAQTPVTVPPFCGGIHTNAIVCLPQAGGQAQAQTPTINWTAFCYPPVANAGGQAQAQTPVTIPPHCGGVYTAPVTCPPPAAGGEPQAQAQAFTNTIALCTGIPYVCGSQAQAQTFSLPPFCPLPAAQGGGGQAQAQTATIALCTGIPHVC